MLVVSEDMQKFCRQYKDYFDDYGVQTNNVAKMVLSLTECMLIEQGVALGVQHSHGRHSKPSEP